MPRTSREWREVQFTSLRSHTLSSAPLWAQEAFLSLLRPQLIARMREWLGPLRVLRRIVDLGCGSGEWTLCYLDLADEVVGVDINAQFLEHARQAAAAQQCAQRVEFVESNLVDYGDLDATDLVCLGACVQYLDDWQLDTLLERLSSRLAPGASIYLRSTVAAPLRPSRRTDLGHYRAAEYYEERFRRYGFKLDDRFRTSAVIPAGVATGLLGVRSFRTARILALPLWLGHAAWRSAVCADDFVNWFFTRATT
jgi:SAM-dependent methyltransferase